MANQQLLLIQDVEGLGRSGDIVHARPGYVRNFLLPGKYAVIASKHALRMQARLQEERRKQAVLDKQEADAMAAALTGITVSTIVKVDHEGHMYGSVSAHDIADLIQASTKQHVEKKNVVLPQALKQLGTHEIRLKLKEGVVVTITLDIVPEDPKFIVAKAAPAPEAPAATETPEA